jgi:hypothetical protein
MMTYPSGFKVSAETRVFLIVTLVYWWLRYWREVIGTFGKYSDPIDREVWKAPGVMFDGSPIREEFIIYMVRTMLFELF